MAPIYEYLPVSSNSADSCQYCQSGFEIQQKLSEPALCKCPSCQNPCRRKLSSPYAATKSSNLLSKENIGNKGFTQYTRLEKGVYERTAGHSGPKIIRDERS